jgi:(p)ppGpp synthase/HD superfamily hydrolase
MEPTPADLARAIAIAATAHADQLDKSGNPYILHPLRVMQRVTEHGLAAQIIAVLHDVVEDTWVTLDMLRRMGFPEVIVIGVDSVTRREGERYFDYIARAAAHPVGALVKLADLADNSDPVRAFAGSGNLLERYGRARQIVEDAIAARTQPPGT